MRTLTVWTILMCCAPEVAAAQETEPAEEPAAASAGPARLTFDDRVVRGSTASGAVVLTTRGQRALPSLVSPLMQLRDRTVLAMFGVTLVTEEPVDTPSAAAGEDP